MVLMVKDLYRVCEGLLNDEDTLRIHKIGLYDLLGSAVHVLQKLCGVAGYRSMFEAKVSSELWLYGKNGRIYYEILEFWDYHSKRGLKPITDSVLKEWELTESAENYLKVCCRGY